jgi:hypothetical protein
MAHCDTSVADHAVDVTNAHRRCDETSLTQPPPVWLPGERCNSRDAKEVTSTMEMTVDHMERTAMPVVATASARRLASPNALQVHGTFAPLVRYRTEAAVKPWTTGTDRHIGATFGRQMAGQPARRLGRAST